VFTLLHTNDFHNRLTGAQAQRLRRLRDSVGAQGLLLDAGDAVSSGNILFRPGGEPVLDLMSDAGYDAMTVGNREFHFTRIGFTTALSRARFPVLCANIRPVGTAASAVLDSSEKHADLPVRPYLLPGSADWRIVLFGLTVPMITERMLSRSVSAYVFDDPLAIAAALVPRLREQYTPDLLVALTHIGIKRDRALAESVPGIDLIIGGHTHLVLEQGERVGGTLIAQAGSHGRYVGRVEAEKGETPDAPPCLRASLERL
jgi:2',3'-cyclic-nucleotide 2'-phosphodiesterase (5'-nucleotidase family)